MMHESGCWHPALRNGTDEAAVRQQPRAHVGKERDYLDTYHCRQSTSCHVVRK